MEFEEASLLGRRLIPGDQYNHSGCRQFRVYETAPELLTCLSYTLRSNFEEYNIDTHNIIFTPY